ncbi:MAG: 4Fe-4S ferredoxin [Candidatus Riflebacteria bacterium HGW-Riflebacteria-1]|jgi:Fe-S-cluster-containing hydrogenase component 2|nr:MAG: 4Fe-4S ferredoxin [Candidatus Riflebacteria bacterium HGW-Riflebacteria-1]
MLKNDGIISPEELSPVVPPADRLARGPVAIIECLQDIPCDPCVSACPVKAIKMKEGITDRPLLEFDTCTGCGLCIPKCPGLAIFVVNMKHTPGMATVSMSYEQLPVPEKGQEVTALDRSGKDVGKVKVVRVVNPPGYDHTAVITIEVPADQVNNIRAIRV